MFPFLDVTALEFEESAEPHEAKFVKETAEDEEDNYADIACAPEEEGSVIDLDYKTRAVDYWKSGKSKARTSAGVIQKFKKVKSLEQLRRWEESVNRGGTHTDKLRFITEYVLTNFENSILDGKIIHDMDLRRWALEAKEEIQENFNKTHKIVSRKITKFITRSTRIDMENLRFGGRCGRLEGAARELIIFAFTRESTVRLSTNQSVKYRCVFEFGEMDSHVNEK
ncbi:hypothetical protein Trydic_g19351 [Trypoxylus dichotomus]